MDPQMNKLFKWSVANSQAPEGAENGVRAPTVAEAANTLTPEMINGLFGGPSDADQMKSAMACIENPDVDIENKLVAFDNLEQLIEGIDNAKNLEPLQLWDPLVKQLKHENEEIRLSAAWCIGTAVQNNPEAQGQFVLHNAMPTLVHIAKTDSSRKTRKKAVYAISSAVRNHQPAMDQLNSALIEGPPTDIEASGIKTAETEISDTKPTDTETTAIKAVDAEASDIKTAETETSDTKPTDTETTAIKAVDAEASDIKTVDATDMEAIDAIMDKLRSIPMDPST